MFVAEAPPDDSVLVIVGGTRAVHPLNLSVQCLLTLFVLGDFIKSHLLTLPVQVAFEATCSMHHLPGRPVFCKKEGGQKKFQGERDKKLITQFYLMVTPQLADFV